MRLLPIAVTTASLILGAYAIDTGGYKRGFADAVEQRKEQGKQKAEFMARRGSCLWSEIMAKDYCSRPMPHVGE